ncbi:MAG TPA: F0F1 ATP synthase subunit alpha, partial [Cytophagaceae bacterium]|nr:F0F1 ATP synthase subunit alpha [Cytophagaceae bacterium]
MSEHILQTVIDDTFRIISTSRENCAPKLNPREIGIITSISEGIVTISGLPGVGFEELLKFPNNLFGIAFNVDETEIGVILLGENSQLNV